MIIKKSWIVARDQAIEYWAPVGQLVNYNMTPWLYYIPDVIIQKY